MKILTRVEARRIGHPEDAKGGAGSYRQVRPNPHNNTHNPKPKIQGVR